MNCTAERGRLAQYDICSGERRERRFQCYRPTSGAWFIRTGSNGAVELKLFGIEEDRPVSGDYNGDGKTDILLYRKSNATWYVLPTGGGFIAQNRGIPTDKPAIPNYLE